MAGDEELRARAVLEDMQLRISQGPQNALGIDAVTTDTVRAAFLALTKQFHPARFGRMAPEVQKLSNEVFLGLKLAHDQLQKALGGTVRGGRANQSGAMRPIDAEGTGRASTTTPLRPIGTAPPVPGTGFARGTDRSVPGSRQSSPVLTTPQRAHTPPTGIPARTMTPIGGVPIGAGTQRSSGQIPRPTLPSGQHSPARTPTGQLPATRAPTGRIPTATRPSTGPLPTATSTRTPTGQVPPVARTGQLPIARPTPAAGTVPLRTMTPPTGTPPLSRPTPVIVSRPGPSQVDPLSSGGIGVTQPLPRIGAASERLDEDAALRAACTLLDQRNWSAARQAFHALAARVPQSKRYRALLCYSRGREAHEAGRGEEALVEYQRALQLEPDLAHVKQAVAELQRRR